MAIKLTTLLLLESHKKFPSCSSPEQIRAVQLLVPWQGSSCGYCIPPSSAFFGRLACVSGCLTLKGLLRSERSNPEVGATQKAKGEGREKAALMEMCYVSGNVQRIFFMNFLIQALSLIHRLAHPGNSIPCAYVLKMCGTDIARFVGVL